MSESACGFFVCVIIEILISLLTYFADMQLGMGTGDKLPPTAFLLPTHFCGLHVQLMYHRMSQVGYKQTNLLLAPLAPLFCIVATFISTISSIKMVSFQC